MSILAEIPSISLSGTPLEPLTGLRYQVPSGEGDPLWLASLGLSTSSVCHAEFLEMVDVIFRCIDPRKNKAEYRRHIELFILCLSRAAVFANFVAVSLNATLYSPSGVKYNRESSFAIRRSRLSYSIVTKLVDVFEDLGLAIRYPGYHSRSPDTKSRTTRLFPTRAFFPLVLPLCIHTEEIIEGPYVLARNASEEWREAIDDNPEDREKLAFINDFLRGHQWACKGPVRRIYTGDPFNGGRIYTAFQGLPARRAKIRINTLIDDGPIAEIDFSASQLRIMLAMFSGIDAGDDPYGEVASRAGVTRAKAKSFFTVGAGASSETQAREALYPKGLKNIEIDAVKDVAVDLWPASAKHLFTGLGVKLQSIEGSILLDVMYRGAQEGIVVLPIHDAVAVQGRHAEWATEAMEKAWVEHVAPEGSAGGGVRPRVKIEHPMP